MRGITLSVAVAAACLAAGAQAADPEVVVYKSTPQGDLELEIHSPEGPSDEPERAAIVYFFGGGWNSGSRAQFRTHAEYLATRGMVAAVADYRIRSKHGTTPMECVEDAKDAVRFLRANAERLGIDPERVAAGGGSAGGHLAAATAVVPGFEPESADLVSSRPDLLVLFNPVLDVVGPARERRPEMKEMAAKISPLEHVDADAPAAIVFFGTEDERFLPGAYAYLKRAKGLGVDTRLYLADGKGHGFFNRWPWQERTMLLADEFLAEHGYLAGEPTIVASPDAPMTLAGDE